LQTNSFIWNKYQIFNWGKWSRATQKFYSGGSTNSVDDRGHKEWGTGGGSPLIRGSTEFSNEWNPVFIFGSYECIFHRTGNSAQLCQNVGTELPNTFWVHYITLHYSP
jgi:hypothetical protein